MDEDRKSGRKVPKRFVVEMYVTKQSGESVSCESTLLTEREAQKLAAYYKAMGHEARVIEKDIRV